MRGTASQAFRKWLNRASFPSLSYAPQRITHQSAYVETETELGARPGILSAQKLMSLCATLQVWVLALPVSSCVTMGLSLAHPELRLEVSWTRGEAGSWELRVRRPGPDVVHLLTAQMSRTCPDQSGWYLVSKWLRPPNSTLPSLAPDGRCPELWALTESSYLGPGVMLEPLRTGVDFWAGGSPSLCHRVVGEIQGG